MTRAAVLALGIALGACANASVAPLDSGPPGQRDAAIDSNGCTTQPCSILPQCGCNGNTACDFDLTDENGTTCRSINANGTETATCNGPVECDRGYVCIGSTFASCKKYCTGDADCSAPRGKCVYEPDPSIPKVCSSNCDPTDTTAAGCPSTYKCSLINFNDGTSVVDCTPAGTMMQGADCTSATNTPVHSRCAKGYECAQFVGETGFKCRKVCTQPGSMITACGGNFCNGYDPAIIVGGTSYGVCGP